jgi:putative flippase GtrA
VIERLASTLTDRLGPERGYAAFRMACYLAVSASALVADVTIYRFALMLLPTAAAAAAVGFVFGVVTHYAVSSRLLFTDILKARGGAAEAPVLGQFFLAGFTGLIVTTSVVWVVADLGGYHPMIAKAGAVTLSFASVFAVLRALVLGNFLQRQSSV